MADDHNGESLMEKISDKMNGHGSSSSSDEEKEKENVPASAHFPPPEVVPESEKASAPAPAVYSPSSPSSPASNSSKSKIYRILNRQQPVHKVLGGGKPADVFLWRNKKTSATGLGVATFIWFLFELLEYHLLTLICHTLIFVLTLLFLWSYASKFIHKAPPRIPDVHIPENTLLEFTAAVRFEINRALHVLRYIASGKDLKRFLQVIGGLWMASIVASWFNFLTFFYLMFVLLHTVPLFYEKYEDQVDAFAEKAMIEFRKHYAVVDAKVLSKIPKGPWKGKKFA